MFILRDVGGRDKCIRLILFRVDTYIIWGDHLSLAGYLQTQGHIPKLPDDWYHCAARIERSSLRAAKVYTVAQVGELAMVEEACVAWDPLPGEANEFWNVDVVYLEEAYPPNESGGLKLIVEAQWQEPATKGSWSRKAWRVHFLGCRAYRMRTVGYTGNPQLTRPDQRRATWEIFPSNYLVEEGVPNGMIPGIAESVGSHHHYVILTGGDTVYEVIGGQWTCEAIGDEWAH